MKIYKNKTIKKYHAKLITYAIITLTLGSIGIYALTSYMEQYTVTGKIGMSLEKGHPITTKEMVKLMQHLPNDAKEKVLEAIKNGVTKEDVKEVYAYYKEYMLLDE